MVRKIVASLSAVALLVVLTPSPAANGPIEQQGCCSHHGGLSGNCCGNGKALCNDGACSPSCKC